MKILWIGDGGAPTGFATVSHAILGQLVDRGHEVHHLALNYNGDPHGHPWAMYPAHSVTSGLYGHERVPGLLEKISPDVVCILNDSWVVGTYQEVLEKQKVVAYIPVDAENQWGGRKLNWLKHAIAYTTYGARELRKGGYREPLSVAPHGIDLGVWSPKPRDEARAALGFKPGSEEMDAFIVGNVNRNQWRKRLDLTLLAFKLFAEGLPASANVKLLLHCALVDAGWELLDLAAYLGIERYIILTGIANVKNYDKMSSLERLRNIYCALDVHVSTSLGEGWGLTAMEAMACDVLNVLPRHSAFGEWAEGGALFYAAPTISVHTGGLNTFGHVPDVDDLAMTLRNVYYAQSGGHGLGLVSQPQYRWSNVGATFDRIFKEVVG